MIKGRFLILLLLIIFSMVLLIGSPLIAHSQVTLDIGNGSGIPGSSDNLVTINLGNLNDKVKGISVDVCDVDNYLTCTGCDITGRTSGFNCIPSELANGCVRVILLSFSGDSIEEGNGPIFTLKCDVSGGAPSSGCVTLTPENETVFNEFGHSLFAALDTGQFCFLIRGDVYPPDNPVFGDGVVNTYDVQEEINFITGMVDPSDCQVIRADVPNGTPPYCDIPDGEITIFDALVIINKALGKANCCGY